MELRLVCVVLIGLCLSVHSAPTFQNDVEKPSNCDVVTSALIDFFKGYANIVRALTGEELDYNSLKEMLGTDFSDPKQVRVFACKLVEVQSITDLAKLLKQPYIVAKIYYKMEQKIYQKLGGREKIIRTMHIELDIFDALSKTGFPSFPVGERASLEKSLKEMIVKYKSGFLKELHPKMIEVTDAAATARDLAQAKNFREFAAVVNLKHAGYFEKFALAFPRVKPVIADVQKMVEAFERMHYVLEKTGYYELSDGDSSEDDEMF